MPSNTNAQTYDCGDGVPDLVLATNGPATEELAIVDAIADEPTTIGAPLAFMALTIVGQLAILLAVLAGGNALIDVTTVQLLHIFPADLSVFDSPNDRFGPQAFDRTLRVATKFCEADADDIGMRHIRLLD